MDGERPKKDGPSDESTGNKDNTKQPVDDTKDVSEITLVPSNVKVSPQTIPKPGRVVFKCPSEPVPPSTRLNGRLWGLRKHFSEPVGLGDGIFRKHHSTYFDNPAFDADDTVPSSPTFADVVRQIITEPIAEDIHPFGRGHLYATALKLDLPTIHQEEGSLFMWFLATAVVLGLVVAVIFMSVMYEPQIMPSGNVTQDTRFNTRGIQNYNTT